MYLFASIVFIRDNYAEVNEILCGNILTNFFGVGVCAFIGSSKLHKNNTLMT